MKDYNRQSTFDDEQFGPSSMERADNETIFRGTTSPTDIGRTDRGTFDRPDTDPDVEPQPIARNNETGRFGLDPFDIGASLSGVGRTDQQLGEPQREIEDIWDVEEGDTFRRDKGMADEWRASEIEEREGFTDTVRRVTFEATDFDGPIADVELQSGNSTQFQREFTPKWQTD